MAIMAYADKKSVDPKEKLASGGIIVAFHAAAIWLLISTMGISADAISEPVDDMLKAFSVAPTVETQPADAEEAAPEAPSSAADEEKQAAPVVTPEPEIIVPTLNEAPASPEPDNAQDADSGAAELPGDGAGSGDEGDDSGTGNSGDGSGGGGEGDGTGSGIVATPPRKISGSISARDYRRATGASSVAGEVTVFYTVLPSGRVTNCTIRSPSRNAARDALTCKLVEQRWRYEPARNAAGEAIADETGWRQRWWPEGGNPGPPPPPEPRAPARPSEAAQSVPPVR